MLSLRRCSFCEKEAFPGEGLMLIRNDGSTEYYCSSKCRLNATVLRRDPRKLKWARGRKERRSGEDSDSR